MSRTRNQRRRDRIFERILAAGMLALLLVLLAMLAKQCADIERMQRTINERAQVTIARTEDFLPEGFDPNCPEYQAASQRYDVEHGYIIPEEKGTAPEAGPSEAGDAREKTH